jgi:hypothetical protein
MSASIAIGGSGILNVRPLRQRVPLTIRARDLGNPPAVASATGLGIGGGAGISHQGADQDASQGIVRMRVGLAPSLTGIVTLQFPQAMPAAAGAIVCFSDLALVVTQGNPLSIAWTAPGPLVSGSIARIAYQWRDPV